MKRSKLSLKQKQFAKRYIETNGNKKQSALDVYDVKPEYASQLASATLEKPLVQEQITKLLNDKGITLDRLNDNLDKGITDNLEYGKPSQSVGADLLKFAYKLHNAIPANKTLNLGYSKKVIESKSTEELTEELKKLNENYSKLVQ